MWLLSTPVRLFAGLSVFACTARGFTGLQLGTMQHRALCPCGCSLSSRLQVGVTAMLIAAKYEEIWAPEVRDFVYISDRAYTKEQILGMEKLMLNTLKFHLTLPTSYNFLARHLKAASMQFDKDVTMLASYLIELAQVGGLRGCCARSVRCTPALLCGPGPVGDHCACRHPQRRRQLQRTTRNLRIATRAARTSQACPLPAPPIRPQVDASMLKYNYSLIAASALNVSMTSYDKDDAYPRALERHCGYGLEEVAPVASALAELMHKAPTNTLTAVFKKYSSAKFGEASKRPAPPHLLPQPAAA